VTTKHEAEELADKVISEGSYARVAGARRRKPRERSDVDEQPIDAKKAQEIADDVDRT
jgi:hypothetical protein